jgi:tRNA threonylcarbamoyladenosine biosynthesis protein TsaB
MRTLALETSGRVASVALLEEADGVAAFISEAHTGADGRTARSLTPLINEILQKAAWPPDSIKLVAVAVGPGSFTGLRIGVTMAKTFAYAVGAQLIGVNTLEVIAEQAAHFQRPLWAVIDAQRQELFAGKFVAGGDARLGQANSETRIISQAAWLAALEPGDHVTGPGLRRLVASLPAGVKVVEQALWQPTAATLGRIALRDYQFGRRDDLWKLVPKYYRPSAAEEKAAQHPA